MSLKHLLNLKLASERATPRAKMKASSIFTSVKKSGMEACGLNAPDCYMVKKSISQEILCYLVRSKTVTAIKHHIKSKLLKCNVKYPISAHVH